MNRIYLYGIAGARDQYRVVRYSWIERECATINNLKNTASWMMDNHPTIEHVYAIDERRGLAYEFKHTFKHPSVEANVTFKDTMEREGLLIY